jgi:hypothetical protein
MVAEEAWSGCDKLIVFDDEEGLRDAASRRVNPEVD